MILLGRLLTLRLLDSVGSACDRVLVRIYAAVMQREFQNADNRVGKGFAILGIYLFIVCFYGMLNSTTWLYGAEVLPMALRSKIMGIAAASHFIVNVGITEAGPSAFATIHENYYYVFVGCSFSFLVMAYFYFLETRRKTLEEIAAAFGNKAILVDERAVEVEHQKLEIKWDEGDEEVERRSSVRASRSSKVWITKVGKAR